MPKTSLKCPIYYLYLSVWIACFVVFSSFEKHGINSVNVSDFVSKHKYLNIQICLG